jgi:predicted phage terminase large subunit-like protein
MTRWHEDDLAGWLLSEESADEDEATQENWHIVCLPAIAEDLPEFPDSCTVEDEWRDIGQPLCPERYPIEKLLKKKAKGSREFDALYQQRPSPKEGYFFDVTKITPVDEAPVGTRWCRGWDKAGTPGGGDYTAGPKVGKGPDGLWYIDDVCRGQWDTATRDRHIRQRAELDGRECHQKGEQEPGSGGLESANNFIRLLSGFPVSVERSTANKEVRADPLSSQVNAGNVRYVRDKEGNRWNKAFIEELRQFPFGKHDDQVDGTSLAFNHLNSHQDWSIGRRTIR